ncbi:siderophore-interacting protein [Streptomyces pratensis]|nr:siderophore-interacting protein [Streptomyces pratensis]QBR06564.1 siderophore-interacting protein [Streptomyces sp. S501]
MGPTGETHIGVRFQPPRDTGHVLICADETALPAASSALEWLPAGTRARARLKVPHTPDRLDIRTEADVRITWLVRKEGAPSAVDAVRAEELPDGTPYVWIEQAARAAA